MTASPDQPRLTDRPTWARLRDDAARLRDRTLTALFEEDPDRATALACHAGPLTLDYARQRLDRDTLAHLLALATDCHVTDAFQALADGAIVNATENRAAGHLRLRDPAVDSGLASRLQRAEALRRNGVEGGPLKHILVLGIGGSHLGPQLVVRALADRYAQAIDCRFVSNVDPTDVSRALDRLDPHTTAVVISSKSFGTRETRMNADTVLAWMDAQREPGWRAHALFAATARPEAATALGVPADNVMTLPEDVGGRFSVWSAIGWPIALALGGEAFDALRHGAHALDRHCLSAAPADNLPLTLALLGIWNRNLMALPAQAIVPYDSRLADLPAYLQQLVMESNGKSCTVDGEPVGWDTAPLVWGGVGTNGQHSFHQWLHQGTATSAVDILVPRRPGDEPTAHHDVLVANALAQSHALAFGNDEPRLRERLIADGHDPEHARWLARHQHIPGNRPNNLLFYDRLDATTLGALLATYEHKTFYESVIWQINAFDQWGVELGKQLSRSVEATLTDPDTADPLPPALAAALARWRQPNED